MIRFLCRKSKARKLILWIVLCPVAWFYRPFQRFFFGISKLLDKQFGRREAPENYAAPANIALARR
jgi:hypothetical protein